MGDDEYIDLDLSDLDAEDAAGEVLDVTLDDLGPTVSGAPRPAETGLPTAQGIPEGTSKPDVPMLAEGVCPRCGYALRPLEEVCPRCKGLGLSEAEKPVGPELPLPAPIDATSPEASPQPLPLPAPRRGCSILTVVLSLLALALIGGVPLWLWQQPGQRARREYQAGLREQLAGRFEAAREHYRLALELDPQMGLAAFSAGTTYLGIGQPNVVQSVQGLTEKAIAGDTQDLDNADRWFRQAAAIGSNIPPDRRLMDQRINTPARLRAFARACLALTALIRASAAIQADQLEDGMGWLNAATNEAQAALADDPSNDQASQVLRAIPPLH